MNDHHDHEHHKRSGVSRLRGYFLTGLIAVAPVAITAYLAWTFVTWVDRIVKPLIPPAYNPDTYLPFAVPGVGVIAALFVITMIGFLTANLVGRTIYNMGENLLDRMPLVRTIYRGLKQIFETVLNNRASNFQRAGLIPYPRQGIWAVVFVSTESKGEVAHRLEEDADGGLVSVFLPTTPNPTSGFLLFVPERDLIPLQMSVEDAAKLVISAGLVTPEFHQQRLQKLAAEAGRDAAE